MLAEERLADEIQIESPKWNKEKLALKKSYEISIKRYLMWLNAWFKTLIKSLTLQETLN